MNSISENAMSWTSGSHEISVRDFLQLFARVLKFVPGTWLAQSGCAANLSIALAM